MKLSILIPSLYRRQVFLQKILSQIYAQDAACLSQTEVLISTDNGTKQIGTKRNELLRSATGEYLVFIDDDDEISSFYLEKIFEGIVKGVDHIGICMLYRNSGIEQKVLCSMNYRWEFRENIHWRSVQHVCAVKKALADKVSFEEINYGEDRGYAARITPLVKSEHLITEPIYFYNYRSNKNGI